MFGAFVSGGRWAAAMMGAGALTISLLLGPAGQAQPADPQAWAGVVAAAKKEGKVTYYTVATQAQVTRLVAGFRKAYPEITIEILRAAGGELLTRIEQERQGGADGADVTTTTEVGWLRNHARAGSLGVPTGPSAREWPAAYLYDGAVVIAGIEPRVIAWNTSLIKSTPRSYRDFLSPEFKGRLGTVEGTSTAFVAFYDWLEKTQGADYLTRLKEQAPRMYGGAGALGQALASGEIVGSLFNVPSSIRPLIEQGAPIAFFATDPNLGVQYATAALGWSKRPNAARVLLDWLMSRPAQTEWHGRGDSASALDNVPGALSAQAITPYDAAAYPPETVAKYRAYWTSIFR